MRFKLMCEVDHAGRLKSSSGSIEVAADVMVDGVLIVRLLD